MATAKGGSGNIYVVGAVALAAVIGGYFLFRPAQAKATDSGKASTAPADKDLKMGDAAKAPLPSAGNLNTFVGIWSPKKGWIGAPTAFNLDEPVKPDNLATNLMIAVRESPDSSSPQIEVLLKSASDNLFETWGIDEHGNVVGLSSWRPTTADPHFHLD